MYVNLLVLPKILSWSVLASAGDTFEQFVASKRSTP